jgi:hypothetical protein
MSSGYDFPNPLWLIVIGAAGGMIGGAVLWALLAYLWTHVSIIVQWVTP